MLTQRRRGRRDNPRLASIGCFRLWLCAPCASVCAPLLSCHRAPARAEVVLYTSCDDYLLRDIIPEFEKQSGLTVRIVGDTEATKTTGLVERLIAEKAHPRADVWWSNEPFGTVRLASDGLLAPYSSAESEHTPGGWPAWLRASDGAWYAFGLRCRAVVYNTRRLTSDQLPNGLIDLAAPEWKGRIGMARPQFGTTRGQIGAILEEAGPEKFRDWAASLKANGVRLYDGNSAVVRAVANGEVDLGLADSDDAFAGEHEKWPVAHAFIGFRPGDAALPLPNTVGEVKGAPHAAEAARLIEFLLSERAERILAASDAREMPARPGLAAQLGAELPVRPIDFHGVEARVGEALRIWDEVFGG